MFVESWGAVEQFEYRVADYTGASYAIAVDTCTTALFLCLQRIKPKEVGLPPRTYLGVACAVVHAGARLSFTSPPWVGSYLLEHTNIVDSACRLTQGMYEPGTLTCLSFQYRKHLKIGRGGMVLTDDEYSARWLRQARFCGRASHGGPPLFIGWQAYMEPERAARGLVLLDSLPRVNKDLLFEYPDLREYEVFGDSSNSKD